MTYPYGTKGAPVVGNGLGGLPRRAVAAAAAVTTSQTPVYTFSEFAHATRATDTPITAFGSFIYFDDSNIFWNANSSSQGLRASFNRSAGTITISNQETIQPAAINIVSSTFDITVSNTFAVSSVNGRTATRSGNTITLGFVVPQSGNLTIGGDAYSVNSFFVRAAPDGSGFVAFAKDNNVGSSMNVFVFNSTFTLLRSFRFTANVGFSSSTAWEIINGVINNNGVFIVCNRDTNATSTITYNIYALNLSTGGGAGATSFSTVAASGGSITNHSLFTSYFEYSTNTFIVQGSFTDGSFHYPYAYSARYNNGVFTNFDGSTAAGSSRGIVASSSQSTLYTNSSDPLKTAAQGVNNLSSLAYTKFGIPYSQFCGNASGANKRKLAMAAPSINNDLLGFTVNKPTIDRESGRSVPTLALVANGDYQGVYTNPSVGFLATANVSSQMIYIGNDLFLIMQQTFSGTGDVSCTILRRTVTFT